MTSTINNRSLSMATLRYSKATDLLIRIQKKYKDEASQKQTQWKLANAIRKIEARLDYLDAACEAGELDVDTLCVFYDQIVKSFEGLLQSDGARAYVYMEDLVEHYESMLAASCDIM